MEEQILLNKILNRKYQRFLEILKKIVLFQKLLILMELIITNIYFDLRFYYSRLLVKLRYMKITKDHLVMNIKTNLERGLIKEM
jgi:hypothetical protein